ncbi:diacylglycerol kinase [Rhizobium sp. MHM7A]|uniref:diacylglycerol kinase n=1 Tax=Rhizobium sp. MHM7A TaxID=2583233 RepID=UPI002484AB66|nr:diacylglycerol kinase [Rhizobium sp. MHM7A]
MGSQPSGAAARYSYQGLSRLSKESAFRHELYAATLASVGLLFLGVSWKEFAIGISFILIVFAAEALNTAIEEVVDHVSPDFSHAAKDAKDLGSLTVAIAIVAAFIYFAALAAEKLMA